MTDEWRNDMPIVRVLARGQVTLPRQVRRDAGLHAGDVLHVEATGPGQVRFTVLADLSPRQLRDRFPVVAPVDEETDREAWQADAARGALGE
jgi:bifunctional DNA-binding transcriptional regulator/antitoxin component of YhaV-PrlF toxin-antitoxin module